MSTQKTDTPIRILISEGTFTPEEIEKESCKLRIVFTLDYGDKQNQFTALPRYLQSKKREKTPYRFESIIDTKILGLIQAIDESLEANALMGFDDKDLAYTIFVSNAKDRIGYSTFSSIAGLPGFGERISMECDYGLPEGIRVNYDRAEWATDEEARMNTPLSSVWNYKVQGSIPPKPAKPKDPKKSDGDRPKPKHNGYNKKPKHDIKPVDGKIDVWANARKNKLSTD